MKSILLGLLGMAIITASSLPSRAQLLADFAANYQGGTVGSSMMLLSDTHGTGTWGYYLAFVNTTTDPTSISGPEILTYQDNADGGSSPTLYGTTASNSYNVIQLPAVSNGKIFPDSPTIPADFLSVHPGGDNAATLVQWTAGAGETGTLLLTFDLSRMNVNSSGRDDPAGFDDFSVFRNSTLIYSDYAMDIGSDTGSVTLTLTGVTTGTTLDFVTSATGGVLGYNLSFLSADISDVPEPATWALLLLGGIGLGAILKRKRTASLV